MKSIQSNRIHILTSNSSILSSSSVYAVEDLQASLSFFFFKNPTRNSCGMSSYCAVQVNNVNFPQPRLTHAPTCADYQRFSAKFRCFLLMLGIVGSGNSSKPSYFKLCKQFNKIALLEAPFIFQCA